MPAPGGECPDALPSSDTLRGVDSLLVAGTTIAGLFIGGVLDPLGQRAADRSREDDDRRRAAALTETGEVPDLSVDHASTVEHLEDAAQDVILAAESDDSDDPSPVDLTIRHLVPTGPSAIRTAAAAIVTGVLFGALANHFGRDIVLAPYCVFVAMLVAVSITDLTHRLVPRRLIYPGLALIVPLLVATSAVDHVWHDLTGALIAGAVAFIVFLAVWWFIPKGMGFGDVRLAGVIGLTTGYLSLLHAYVAFLAGFVAGMLFGVVLMVVSSAGRKTRIPFAPSLALGAVIAVLWGGHLAHDLFHAGT
jgi:leader peptidase (prepilin peptidase)/N-methyltransferase